MAVLVVTAGLSYCSVLAAVESDRRVRHSYEVIETLKT
jgi:hypothetical protein